MSIVSTCKWQKTPILPPLRYNIITTNFWFEGHFQKSAKHIENTGTAPLAYDGARGRTGQRRARRALSGRAHRIDGAAVVALTLAARPVPAGTSSSSGAL